MKLVQTALLAGYLLTNAHLASADTFYLSSTDIAAGKKLNPEQVFEGFGCSGKNLSPALAWHHPPAGTKSFAITAYDPDAPTGSGWWHWLVFDLPKDTQSLPKGLGKLANSELPGKAIASRTDFGQTGFGGACPPIGDGPHRYVFTVWALNTDSLGLQADTSPALVGYMLNAHKIDSASIKAWYIREE